MSVSSINGEKPAFPLQPLKTATTDPSVKGITSGETASPQNTAARVAEAVSDTGKAPPEKEKTNDEREATRYKPIRTMNHVVAEYNPQGKVRIRFMDSQNNVVYQIPSEMVAKMEDQMMKPETATTVKG